MGRYTGMTLHGVVTSTRLGRDVHGFPLYSMTLDCGHVEERVVRSYVPKRTRCYHCQPNGTPMARARNRPTGLRPPLCVGCRVHPVSRRFGTVPPKRGWRMIGGVAWNWYCSEGCACRAMGRAQFGKMGSEGGKVSVIQAEARALERLTAACKAEMTPEGLVPVKAMVKAFMLLRRKWRSDGYTSGLLKGRRELLQRRSA